MDEQGRPRAARVIGRPPEDDPRARWDARYAGGGGPRKTTPHPWLVQHIWRVPTGKALEVACGMGRDSIFLAQQGFYVHAVDISAVALREARRRARLSGVDHRVHFVVADLTRFAFPTGYYDLVVGFSYWEREIRAALRAAVRPGGFIIYETFNVFWAHTRPDICPRYLVEPGELLAWLQDWEVLAYREIGSDRPDSRGYKAVSSIVARKPITRGGNNP